jgi:hypothetical protein
MPTSDEDLQKQSERVQKLREQVADAEAKRVERESSLANDVTMAQLQAEEAALEARLAVAKEAGKVGNVKSGASAPLDAAKEQLKRAVAQKEAAEKAPEEAARQSETADKGVSGDSASATATGEGN